MKKIITDTINLDELNGATLGTWINTLRELQDEVGKSATISAFAHADTPNDIGCTLEISYERLETDEEESERLVNEDLKIKKIKNFSADFGVTIKEVNFL
jgi:predicted polyphosphate/ATP-dependent NAD kinase